MRDLKITAQEKKALAVATAVALIGGAYFLRSYIMLVIIAAIFAFLFNPVYKYLLKRWKSPGKASMATLLITLLAIIIPLLVVLAISVRQVNELVTNFDTTAFSDIENSTINTVNDWLQKVGVSYKLGDGTISAKLYDALQNAGQELVSSLPALFGSFFAFLTSSIIFLYVFLSLLKNQSSLLRVMRALNPLGEDISNMYIDKTAAMTKAMVRGQFLIAFAQGLASAAVLALVGLPELFFFFLVVLTALSIIPLGAGIVTIPIGIVMILTGNVAGGVIVILNHLIIVTNIDNVMRPHLVPKEAKLDAALTLLSVFAGLHVFGFFGIIIGPVLMILIVTTIRVYLEVYEGVSFGDNGSNKGIVGKTKNKVRSLFRRPSKA